MLRYEGAGVTDEETGKDELRDSLIWLCVCVLCLTSYSLRRQNGNYKLKS